MAGREELIKNFQECVEGARSEEGKKRFRNAVELYYKAFVALCDVLILDKTGDTPDFHKKRDEILAGMNGDINNLRLGLHTLYRQSYYRTDFKHDDVKKLKEAIKTVVTLKRPGKDIEAIIKEI